MTKGAERSSGSSGMREAAGLIGGVVIATVAAELAMGSGIVPREMHNIIRVVDYSAIQLLGTVYLFAGPERVERATARGVQNIQNVARRLRNPLGPQATLLA